MAQSAHKAHFLSIHNVVILKKGQGHQNLITSFAHPGDVSVLVWSNIFQPLVEEIVCTQTFYKAHF